MNQFLRTVLPVTGILLALAYAIRAGLHLFGATSMPVDQAIQYWNIKQMLSGVNYLDVTVHTSYPPSYLLFLSPLFSLPYEVSIWCWAALNVISIFIFIYLISAQNWRIGATLAGAQSLFQTIGIGQFGLLPVTAAATISRLAVSTGWPRVAGITLCAFVLAGKPSIGIPLLFWLFFRKNDRAGVFLAAVIHLSLLFIAAHLMQLNVLEMLIQWLQNQSKTGQEFLGKNDLFLLLHSLGFPSPLLTPLAIIGSALAGWFAVRNRFEADLAVAVLLIAARLLFYHNDYDNLMLLPALAMLLGNVFQSSTEKVHQTKFIPALVLLLALSLWIPARLLDVTSLAGRLLTIGQALIWIATAWILVYQYRTSANASESSPPKNAS
jgi:hypothetical protein